MMDIAREVANAEAHAWALDAAWTLDTGIRPDQIEATREAAIERHAIQCEGEAPRPLALAGLVSSRTSDTASDRVDIDPVLTRMRRMRRAVTTGARMIEWETRGRRFKPAMVTLTYRDADGWSPRHVSELLKRIRQWCARRGEKLRYVWVAELQARGAVHYHVLLWLRRGLTLPKPDKQGWWPHGSTRIEWARKPVGYLAKYASKIESKAGSAFPAGLRLHGRGGLDETGRAVCSWYGLPAWARALCDLGGRAVRRKGIGLVERGTGVCLPSPWRVSFSAGGVTARCLFEHPGSLRDVGGPYSWLPGREATTQWTH